MTDWFTLRWWWLGVRYRCLIRKTHRYFERLMLGRGK